MKTVLKISAIVVISSFVAFAQPGVGDIAPDFSLPDTAGISHSLSDFAGDIVLLNFFATWCPPCAVEAPQLESEIWQVYGSQGVTVIGLDFQEIIFPLLDFIQEKNLTYPVLRDTAGAVFQNLYGLTIFPSNVLIGRDGRIVHIEEGFDIPLFVSLVDSLLNVTSIEPGLPVVENAVVRNLELLPAFPNPFNNQTRIRFRLNSASPVELKIFDSAGRLINRNALTLQAGPHNVAVDMSGHSSGVYFFAVKAGAETRSGKFILRK